MEKLTKKLEVLKAKPESTRRRIAFITSSSITLVIFLFWVASLGSMTATTTDAVGTPLSSVGTSLSASVSDSFGAVSSAFSGLFSGGASQKSSIEVLPGTVKQDATPDQNSSQDNQQDNQNTQ